MNKYQREMLRHRAWNMRIKASRYISTEWNKYQIAKYGLFRRMRNQAIGSKGKENWHYRMRSD